jgi:hypothetical protein
LSSSNYSGEMYAQGVDRVGGWWSVGEGVDVRSSGRQEEWCRRGVEGE